MEQKQYKLIPNTFFWMFLGLLGTAIISVISYKTDLVVDLLEEGMFRTLMVVELLVVIVFSLLFRKLPTIVVTILYFVYAMINGITLSVIFYAFELNSIIIVFCGAAALYAILGLYGYKTNADVSRWQPILSTTLIIGVIVSIINLFIGNTVLDLILDWAILILMSGVTIYDMNKLQRLSNEIDIDSNKAHIYCAMDLYLDFINIFLRILSLFGKRKD